MKKILLLITCLFTLQLGWGDDASYLRDPAAYNELIKDNTIQLVDVRTLDEFNEGTIGKAQNIDYVSENFTVKLKDLNKDEPVYVFCRSGNRSEKARKI
ncbi:MAG: rhodanese-like domain-containing protein, partial [Wohlfahrtiimonas sp.]